MLTDNNSQQNCSQPTFAGLRAVLLYALLLNDTSSPI